MSVPTPTELVETYGAQTPEALATLLGFQVHRRELPPVLPGVTVISAYQPEQIIIIFSAALRQLAAQRREPLARLEQWHIAHELYHGLAEQANPSPWRVRETAADMWADELIALV